MLIPTPTTGLRGMPRVYLDHGDTTGFSFVLDKRIQLGKTPTVQTPFVLNVLVLFAPSHLGGFTNSRQVFKHESRASGSLLDNTFRENVIMVFVSPKLFPTQLTEMPFRRFGAFGLQFPFQAEGTSFLFFPSTFTQEVTIAGDSRSVQSQVNPDHFMRWRDNWLRKGDNDMKSKTPLAIAQISTTDFGANVLHQVSRDGKGQFNPSVDSSKTTGECVPLDPVRTLIITDTCHLTVRTLDRLKHRGGLALLHCLLNLLRIGFFVFDLPGESRFDALCCLDTSSTHQLRGKVRVLCSEGIVRPFMQLNPVTALCRKAFKGHGIKTGGMLFKRCLEALCLLRCRVELYLDRSIHAKSISYITRCCQAARSYPFAQAPRKEVALHPRLERTGFPCALRYEDWLCPCLEARAKRGIAKRCVK